MRGSYLAKEIDKEYKRKQAYQKKPDRQKCNNKNCNSCEYEQICDDSEGSD